MTKEKKNNLFYVKIFLTAFAAIFLIAVVFRIYSSYVSRQFTENSFNILIISDKYIGVVGVDARDKKLNSAIVTEELDPIKKRNILIQSINFGIPIHAYIVFPKGVETQNPTKTFFSLGNIKNISTNFTISKKNISFFDWIRLYRLSNNIDENKVIVKTYATITDLSKLLSREDEDFFRNSDLVNRKTSLQVINGTNINGLGNRVGDMFSRFGFNVVSVTTNPVDKSAVYYSEDSALKDALVIAKSLDFSVEKSNEYAVASVTIVIGEDSELLLEDLAY